MCEQNLVLRSCWQNENHGGNQSTCFAPMFLFSIVMALLCSAIPPELAQADEITTGLSRFGASAPYPENFRHLGSPWKMWYRKPNGYYNAG